MIRNSDKFLIGGLAAVGCMASHAQEPAWHTVLLTPQVMVAARRADEQPWLGRAILVQVRSANRQESGWQLARQDWLAVACNGPVPSAAVLSDDGSVAGKWSPSVPPGVPAAPVLPADQGGGPSPWHAVAAWACLARGGSDAVQAQVANKVMQTVGLPDVQAWSCALSGRSRAVTGDVKLGFSGSAQLLRLNDTWLSGPQITPVYWSFEQAGMVWRVVLPSGAMRVVRQDSGETVAAGQCIRAPGYVPLNEVSGW